MRVYGNNKECVGKCPKCGSEDLDYDASEMIDESLGYPFTCKDCGCVGVEWYSIVYSETYY